MSQATILVPESAVRPVQARPPLLTYVRQLWHYREFIIGHSRSKSFTAGRNLFLGKLWLILDPILQVAVYVAVFGLILKVSRGVENFVGFLTLGVVWFGFLTEGLASANNLVQANKNMISSFAFPAATVIFSRTLRSLNNNLFPAAISIAVALLFQQGQHIGWASLLVAPMYLLIHLFALGTTFWVAMMTAFLPDIGRIVGLMQRALFFVSGIFFTIERFDAHPTLAMIVEINPYYQFLMAVRTIILYGESPELKVWLYLVCWTILMLVSGLVVFWRGEGRYARVK